MGAPWTGWSVSILFQCSPAPSVSSRVGHALPNWFSRSYDLRWVSANFCICGGGTLLENWDPRSDVYGHVFVRYDRRASLITRSRWIFLYLASISYYCSEWGSEQEISFPMAAATMLGHLASPVPAILVPSPSPTLFTSLRCNRKMNVMEEKGRGFDIVSTFDLMHNTIFFLFLS